MAPANGQYFDDQQSRGVLNPWEVIGLHPEDSNLTLRGIRLHIRKVVLKHVFERGGSGAATCGPNVPLWRHVNMAKEMFENSMNGLRTRWHSITRMQWDPYCPPGSPGALVPLGHRNVPPEYYASAAPTEDDYDRQQRERKESARKPTSSKQSASSSTFSSAFRDCKPGSNYSNPFESKPPPADDKGKGKQKATASSPPAPGTPSKKKKTPSAAPMAPPTPTKRRMQPRGVFLGSWKGSGLPAHLSNAVYGSRDAKGRFNRRISKEDNAGNVVFGGRYDSKRTACKHEDVRYATNFATLGPQAVEQEVDRVENARAAHAVGAAPAAGSLVLTWGNLRGPDDEEEIAV